VKLLVQFSPASCYFLLLGAKYSLQRPVLKRPQSVFDVSALTYWLSLVNVSPFDPSLKQK
jgi:hypothetical protein